MQMRDFSCLLGQHETRTQWPRVSAAPHVQTSTVPAGETISESYITEYSTDKIEMHTGAVQPGQKVVLVSVCEQQ